MVELQTAEIRCGMWPTMMPDLIKATAYGSEMTSDHNNSIDQIEQFIVKEYPNDPYV